MNRRQRRAREYQKEHGVSRREAFQKIDTRHQTERKRRECTCGFDPNTHWTDINPIKMCQSHTFWTVVRDDPDSVFENYEEDQHSQLLESSTPGQVINLLLGTDELIVTNSKFADSIRYLEGDDAQAIFNRPMTELKVLQLKLLGAGLDRHNSKRAELEGVYCQYVIQSVHAAADVYARPGTRLRELIEMFELDEEGADLNCFQFGDQEFDGLGDPVSDKNSNKYSNAENRALRAAFDLDSANSYEEQQEWMKRGVDRIFPASCISSPEIFAAYIARGEWTEEWTPEDYQRIAGRFALAFGKQLHPDDDFAVDTAV